MKSIAQFLLVGLIGTSTIIIGVLIPPLIVQTTVDKELLFTYGYEKAEHSLLSLLSLVEDGKSVYEVLGMRALLNNPEGLSQLKIKFDQLLGENCISVTKRITPGSPQLTGYNEGPTQYVTWAQQTYKVAVQNLGDVDAGVFNIKWFVDDSQEGFGSHNGIPRGTTANNDNDELTRTFSDGGPHIIEYAIDVDNHITESNEDDNKIKFYVSTGPQPEFLSNTCPESTIKFDTILVLPYNKNSLAEIIRIGLG